MVPLVPLVRDGAMVRSVWVDYYSGPNGTLVHSGTVVLSSRVVLRLQSPEWLHLRVGVSVRTRVAVVIAHEWERLRVGLLPDCARRKPPFPRAWEESELVLVLPHRDL